MTAHRMRSPGPIRQVPVGASGAGPYAITHGPDSALWITLVHAGQIERLDPVGRLDIHKLAGLDGALWFTLNQAHAIGRLSMDGEAMIYPLATPGAGPVGITAALDAVWFVEIAASQVGRISPNGRIEEFALFDRNARPHAIIADPDHGCWCGTSATSVRCGAW